MPRSSNGAFSCAYDNAIEYFSGKELILKIKNESPKNENDIPTREHDRTRLIRHLASLVIRRRHQRHRFEAEEELSEKVKNLTH
ncbi:hypothetical protein [uncultured Rubinisphaera sp.]|uniref:hypothetical protein n=1 Tax=uncultured Rubinisphaera sp. TaxID=1678686 RepID=UPI0030D734B8|tara:strand:+ start:1404 stop:1655 length:252 start_codon:yes stop_codon:yes gene_type:complete